MTSLSDVNNNDTFNNAVPNQQSAPASAGNNLVDIDNTPGWLVEVYAESAPQDWADRNPPDEVIRILMNEHVNSRDAFRSLTIDDINGLPISLGAKGQLRLVHLHCCARQQAHATLVQAPRVSAEAERLMDQIRADYPQHQQFIYSPLACPFDAFGRPLGQGSYASVLRATLSSPDGRKDLIAKKVFDRNDYAFLEFTNHVDLNHPNIIRCFGISVTIDEDPRVCLLLELGSRSFASDRFVGGALPFSAIEVHEGALQIARGTAHLHSRNFVHADLKPQNIIVVGVDLKLGDLGSATRIGSILNRSVCSTPRYAPPEYFYRLDTNYHLEVVASFDVFAIGVILFRMLRRRGRGGGHRLFRDLKELARRCCFGVASRRPQDAGRVVAILERMNRSGTHQNHNNNDDDDDEDDHVGDDFTEDQNGDTQNYSNNNNNNSNQSKGGNRSDSSYNHDVNDDAADEVFTNEQLLGLRYKFVAEETRKLSFEKEAWSELSSVLFSQTIDDSSHRLFADFMNPKIHLEKYKLENLRMLQSAYLSSVFLGAHKYDHERLQKDDRLVHHCRDGINNLNKRHLEDPSRIGKYPRLSRILFAWHATTINNIGDVLTHGPSRRGFGIDGVFYLDADRALAQVSGCLEDKRLILYVVSVSQVRMSEDAVEDDEEEIFDSCLNSEIGELTIDYRWRALPVAIAELSFVTKNQIHEEEGVTKPTSAVKESLADDFREKMLSRTRFLIPTFNKEATSKVHTGLTISGNDHIVTHPAENGNWKAAVANEFIDATVNGEHIFSYLVNEIGDGNVYLGVTSNENSANLEFTAEIFQKLASCRASSNLGCGLLLQDATFAPDLIPSDLLAADTKRATKVIVKVAIAGASRKIQFFVDCFESASYEFAAHCEGAKLFPIICFCKQNQQVTATPINNGSAAVRTLMKDYEEFIMPQTPLLVQQAFLNNFPEQLALKLRGDIVHAVFFGLAGAGKSTVFNFINYVLHGGYFPGGRVTRDEAASGGEVSTECARERASDYLEWDVKQQGDLLITDTVACKGDESEVIAIGNGKLKEIEAWPRDLSEASIHKRAEILKRPAQTTRPTCFVLFISSDQLMNANDKANDSIVNSILEAAKTKFKIGEYQIEIPLMIVITKADKIESKPSKEDLLFQRKSHKLADIVTRCSTRFKIPKADIFTLGFMNDHDEVDFSPATKDPRVLAIRHLLLTMTEGAQMCAKKLKKLEQC